MTPRHSTTISKRAYITILLIGLVIASAILYTGALSPRADVITPSQTAQTDSGPVTVLSVADTTAIRPFCQQPALDVGFLVESAQTATVVGDMARFIVEIESKFSPGLAGIPKSIFLGGPAGFQDRVALAVSAKLAEDSYSFSSKLDLSPFNQPVDNLLAKSFPAPTETNQNLVPPSVIFKDKNVLNRYSLYLKNSKRSSESVMVILTDRVLGGNEPGNADNVAANYNPVSFTPSRGDYRIRYIVVGFPNATNVAAMDSSWHSLGAAGSGNGGYLSLPTDVTDGLKASNMAQASQSLLRLINNPYVMCSDIAMSFPSSLPQDANGVATIRPNQTADLTFKIRNRSRDYLSASAITQPLPNNLREAATGATSVSLPLPSDQVLKPGDEASISAQVRGRRRGEQ